MKPLHIAPVQLAAKIKQCILAHPQWALVLAVLFALVPFLAKPFNMDDPLFVWTAQQIQAHPLDPYGFQVNWYGVFTPMSQVTQNPPLAAYYMSVAGDVLGWSEIALHAAFLLPALAVILGTYRLAGKFCLHPFFAALVTLFSPVFLISATTVMCDVLMLAFWIWAVIFWMEGLERNDILWLTTAATLAALAALTKYFGICLIPLLAVHAWRVKRRLGAWAILLLIPIATLLLYQWATRLLYQHALLSEAAAYVSSVHKLFGLERAASLFTALVFVGGCMAPAVLVAPWIWPRKFLFVAVAAVLVVSLAFFWKGAMLQTFADLSLTRRALMGAQVVFWAIGGVFVLALAAADVRQARDDQAWLLALWVGGTFVFTGIFNWTINGRSILPLAPAVAILLARRCQYLSRNNPAPPLVFRRVILIPTALCALFSIWLAQADYLYAAATRTGAEYVRGHYGNGPGQLWFEGHWGFQYYMQELGALPLDYHTSLIHPDDFIAVPFNNSNLNKLPAPGDRLGFRGPRWLATMDIEVGAAFYASMDGRLPFAFGPVPPEPIIVYNHVEPEKKP